ncbi:MAG: class I SAM-dependent methyltransferase [Synechococcales cyanobacterium M58_A2018_015]|nr:class I SAM-dependent methyltransferase [Synechococcales cyanobacterium M58_A2018_015]
MNEKAMQTYQEFEFCHSLQHMLEAQKAVGRSGKTFERLGAASTKNNLLALRSLMLEFKPQRTLEIGLAFGASCLTLAASHRDLNHQADRQHVAIDPYQSTVWDDTGRLALQKAGLLEYVDIRENPSCVVLAELLAKKRNFDLIYIDGSHLFEDVFVDFYYSGRLLAPNGLMLFDDSADPHIRKVLEFIDSNFSSSYQKLDLSHLRSGLESIKFSIATILKKNQLTVYKKVGRAERPWNSKFKNF